MRNSNEFIRVETMAVQPGYRLRLKFSDGVTKVVDFASYLLNDEMSAPLREESFFAQVKTKRNGRVLEWPNGYDADADWLHSIPTVDEYYPTPDLKNQKEFKKPQMQLLQQFERLSEEEKKQFVKLLNERYPEIDKAS